MKIFFLLFLFFLSNTQDNILPEIREQYSLISKSKEEQFRFIEKIKNYQNLNSSTMDAYKAVGQIIESKYEKKNKKVKLKEGILALENLIKKEPNHIEMRLLRLSIQENLPSVIGYNKNIEQDKKFILKNLYLADNSLKKHIINFIKSSKSFTIEEKKNTK